MQTLTERLAAVSAGNPIRQLHGLADAYLACATEHPNLLRALFEHRMENDRPFPEDILLMVMEAFSLMHAPLVQLLPDRDGEDVAQLARMMFSAVHGIISLGLEERMVAVPPEQLRQRLAQFIDTHLAGLGVARPYARRARARLTTDCARSVSSRSTSTAGRARARGAPDRAEAPGWDERGAL